jgi:diadenosine tetraphosphate (Ap4A) HIT family hydrolase
METCPFCTGPSNKARTIVSTDLVWAFPTNIPIVPGHTLIAPVRCVKTFDELTQQERDALFELMERIKGALKKRYGAEGFNIAWNEGAAGGQTVFHFHVHVLPRTDGDTGVYQYDPRQFLYRPGSRETTPESELLAVAQEIRTALN